jgi:hypothetical protein
MVLRHNRILAAVREPDTRHMAVSSDQESPCPKGDGVVSNNWIDGPRRSQAQAYPVFSTT